MKHHPRHAKAVAAIAPFNPITTAPLFKTPSETVKQLSYYQYCKITIDNISTLAGVPVLSLAAVPLKISFSIIIILSSLLFL
jgi:hypothetical protein